MNSENPYAPTAAAIESPVTTTQDELIRRQHINHEASVKSVGTLYLIGSILLILGLVAVVFILITASASAQTKLSINELLITAVILIGLIALQLWIALGLHNLNPKVRIPVIILSCVGLIGFPVGTVISAWVLYLVASKKGKLVLSNEYKRVIAATPHIKYKTSIFVWVVLGIFLILLAAGAAARFFER